MPDERELFQQIGQAAARMKPDLITLRRLLHQHPELGWLEFQTAAHVCATLEDLGYQVRTGQEAISGEDRFGVPSREVLEAAWERARSAGAPLRWLETMRGGYTGVVADLDTGKPGMLVAFRFDLDALPVHEAVDAGHLPASQGWLSRIPGAMHACGHDGHLSIGLALARLAVELAPSLAGRIRLIFQPAEEGVRGALAMTRACAGVDRLVCIHIGLGVPSGQVIGGAVGFLATREYRASFKGQAAHAGLEPEVGRSALLAAAQAALALHTLAQYAGHEVRVNVGILRGGVATSIVPPEAELLYRIRADDNSVIEALDQRAHAAVLGAAATYGCHVELEIIGRAGSEDSHPELAALAADLAQSVPGVKSTSHHHPFGASEDATHLMQQVHRQGGQATYIMLGADLAAGHHNERFDFDENSLAIGLELLGKLLVRLLLDSQFKR
jgi:aminobenzoyl-glutamate utilization protein A